MTVLIFATTVLIKISTVLFFVTTVLIMITTGKENTSTKGFKTLKLLSDLSNVSQMSGSLFGSYSRMGYLCTVKLN